MKTHVLRMFCLWLLTVPSAASPAEETQPYIISGAVTDASGNPIDGAVVEWARWWDRAGHRKTVTDKDGLYRLEVDEGDRDWLLFASAEGFAPAWKGSFLFQPKGQPTRQNFSLPPGHWLEGNVMNTRGEPLTGITVKVTREMSEMTFFDYSSGVQFGGMDLPGERRVVTTDENGFFRFDSLPAGKVALWIDDETWDQHWENHEVDRAISISLEERYADWDKVIRGRVVDDETGEPVPEFTVWVYRKEKTFRSDDGRFVFPGLFGYRYGRVFVTADGNRCAVGREISAEPEAAAPEHEFRLKNQGLEGYVVDAVTGERLAGIPISHGFAEIDRLRWENVDEGDPRPAALHDGRMVVSGDDGSFRFCEPEDEKGILAILHEPYARMFLTPKEREHDLETTLLRVKLRPGATLSGSYLRDGRPVPHGDIHLARGSVEYESVSTDENGRFSFRCLDPGEYRMAVYTRVGQFGFAILTAKTEVGPGEHRKFNLSGPDGPITITGRTLSGGKPVPWMPVFLTPHEEGRQKAYACSDAEGRYRIPGLHEGSYNGAVGLHAIPGNKTDFTIRVSGDAEMDLPPAKE